MLALPAVHPYAPTPDVSVTRFTFAHSFTHQIPLLALRKRPSPASLVGIPKAAAAAAAAPHLPPENANSSDGLISSGSIKHKPLAVKMAGQKKIPVKLVAAVGLWCFQNVIFNIYSKKALILFPYPWLLASFQLLVGSLWMAGLWSAKLQPFPRVSRSFLLALLGPALFHAAGHVAACISLSKLAVSFSHVINTSEPVFSVIFSALHGHFFPIHVWLSVIPIVAGCAVAGVTEASFNAAGLWSALISNAGFVLRNIYSEQSLCEFKDADGLNLYGWISIVSLLYLFPVAVIVEGRQWVEGYRTAMAAAGSSSSFCTWVLLSGVFYHLCNQSLYQGLNEIGPESFWIGGTMKRVVVIMASVILFRNRVGPMNAAGSAIAIFGAFLYAQATAVGKKTNKRKRLMIAKER